MKNRKPLFQITYHSEIAGEQRPTSHGTFTNAESAEKFARVRMKETAFKVEPVVKPKK